MFKVVLLSYSLIGMGPWVFGEDQGKPLEDFISPVRWAFQRLQIDLFRIISMSRLRE